MQIHQILIRPRDHTVIVLFEDLVGRRESLFFDSTGNPKVEALLAECQQKLPPDSEHPAKQEIETQIGELQYRLSQLKKSIGES
jgi:hypothetical protein